MLTISSLRPKVLNFRPNLAYTRVCPCIIPILTATKTQYETRRLTTQRKLLPAALNTGLFLIYIFFHKISRKKLTCAMNLNAIKRKTEQPTFLH